MPLHGTRSGESFLNPTTMPSPSHAQRQGPRHADQVPGRPTVVTPAVLQKLDQAFAWGCTDQEACFYASIGMQSLYNYQHKNPAFLERKLSLKQRPILIARRTVVDGLTANPTLAFRFLERKRHSKFGITLKHECSGEELQPNQIDVQKMSDEELDTAITLRLS